MQPGEAPLRATLECRWKDSEWRESLIAIRFYLAPGGALF